jgi:uncharacterized alkaline shock family protein YloU
MEDLAKTNVGGDKIKISEEVVATIAGVTALEVDNVALSGGFVDGLAGMLGKKNLGKGIRVEMREDTVTVELSLTVQFGAKIHELAKEVQQRVRDTIIDMTGLKVASVNVNVLGVTMEKEDKSSQIDTEFVVEEE